MTPLTILIASVLGAVAPDRRLVTSAVYLDDYAPCGQASLYLICQLREREVAFSKVAELTGRADAQGCHSFKDLITAAERLGLTAVAMHVDRQGLSELPTPLIIQSQGVGGESPLHLSVVLSITEQGPQILDAPYRPRVVSWPVFEQLWTGNVLAFSATRADARRIDDLRGMASRQSAINWCLALSGLLAACMTAWNFGRNNSSSDKFGRDEIADSRRVGLRRLGLRRLPALIFLVLAAVAMVAVSALWISNRAAGSPSAQVVDLGELLPGEHQSVFSLANPNSFPLEVSRVESSCSCLVVTRPTAIEAGGKQDIDVKVNVGPGRGYANVTLFTNGPEPRREVVFTWLGRSKPLMIPRQIPAVYTGIGASYRRTVNLIYPGGSNATAPRVDRIECDNSAIHVRCLGADNNAFRIASGASAQSAIGYLTFEVEVESPSAPGLTEGVVVLGVKYGSQDYEYSLPVAVHFEGAIGVQPSAALFSARRLADLKSREVSLRIQGQSALPALTIARCPKWVSCTIADASPTESRLQVRICDDPPDEIASEVVEIVARDNAQVLIPVKVTAFAEGQ